MTSRKLAEIIATEMDRSITGQSDIFRYCYNFFGGFDVVVFSAVTRLLNRYYQGKGWRRVAIEHVSCHECKTSIDFVLLPQNDLPSIMIPKDDANDMEGLFGFIEVYIRHDPKMMVAILSPLAFRHRWRLVYVVCAKLAEIDYPSAFSYFWLSIGGLLMGDQLRYVFGLNKTRGLTRNLSDEQYGILHDALFPSLSRLFVIKWENPFVLKILEAWKTTLPSFHRRFDWDAQVPVLTPEKLVFQPHDQSLLTQYAVPPADTPRCNRSVVIVGWPTPLVLRIKIAMTAYGWQVAIYQGESEDSLDYSGLPAWCVERGINLVVLDDSSCVLPSWRETKNAQRYEALLLLRQTVPDIKIVGFTSDAQCVPQYHYIMLESIREVDILWECTVPSFSLWACKEFDNKLFHSHFPHWGWSQAPEHPIKSEIEFRGCIAEHNFHRAFWMAAAEHTGLPIVLKLSEEDPYETYMQNIHDATCIISFCTRSNDLRIVTGRCFETLLCGSLLIQEHTPELDYYFIAGEHYLEFSTLPELRAVVNFIKDHPEKAEEIRRKGHEFAVARYSDERIIGSLDYLLYHRQAHR